MRDTHIIEMSPARNGAKHGSGTMVSELTVMGVVWVKPLDAIA